MSAARVDSAGVVKQLDGRAGSPEVVTEPDVQDVAKLTRLLGRVLGDVAEVRRNFVPRRVDYEDVVVTGAGASYPFPHGFGGRVRWWVVDWVAASLYPALVKDTTLTDDDTLWLKSSVAGTVTVRIEEAG